MNTVIFFLMLTSSMAEYVPRNTDMTEAECGFNLFCYLNDSLLDTMNKIFIMLSLDSNFTDGSKVKLLLNMHDNLRIIAENNYKIYQEITNTSKANYDNKTVKPLFNLTEAIEDYFHEQRQELTPKNKTEVNDDNHDIIFHNETLCWFETNESAINSAEFLSNFLEKVDKLGFEDLIESTKKLINGSFDSKNEYFKYTSKHKTRKTIKTFNLKPWRPENSSEVSDTRRIFKGKRSKIKRYPFAASFHMTGEFLCAGSIISKNMILSAASCLQIPYNYKSLHDNPNYLTVRIGSDFTNKMGDLIPVVDIIFHPAYDPVNLQNNLAIAKIKRPIVFQRRNKKIRRIEFDRKTNALLDEAGMVTILGWGDKNKYDTNSHLDPISYAHLHVYPLQECKDIYSPRYVTEMHFCAGFKQIGTGACNRDVGGPGIVGSVLVGVVSFGPPVCGTPDTPTVFTKISYYTAWIDDITTSDQAEDGDTTTLPSILREREMVKVIVKELPIAGTTPSTTTTKEIPKRLRILKKLFKELIQTGTIDVNELLFNSDGNSISTTEASIPEESIVLTTGRNINSNKILREGEGMMMQEHVGVYKSTKGLRETERIIYDKEFSLNPIMIQPVDQNIRAAGMDNYETQIINLEPETEDEGLSIEYIPRAKVDTQPTNNNPLPSAITDTERDLRHITKRSKNIQRNHSIIKERMVGEADAATDEIPFEVDEDLQPIVTTKPPPTVFVKAREDPMSKQEVTTIKTYDAEESGAANLDFEIIAGGDTEERTTKKSILDYVNFK